MNPFCKRPPSNPHMAEDRTKLPDNLFVDTNYCQISYLESLVGNKLMIFDIPNEDAGKADGAIAKLTKHIPKGNSCQIVEAPADLKLATPENIVILKFLNRSDLIEYLQEPTFGQRPKIFGPRELAKLLHAYHGQADLTSMQSGDKEGLDLGMGSVSSKEAVGVYKIFCKFILKEVLPADFSAALAGMEEKETPEDQFNKAI